MAINTNQLLQDTEDNSIPVALQRRSAPVITDATTSSERDSWAKEAASSIWQNTENMVPAVSGLVRKLAGDNEGAQRKFDEYAEGEAVSRRIGPKIQSFEDASEAGGGVGDYGAALGYMGASLVPDAVMSLTGAGVGAVVGKKVAKEGIERVARKQLREFVEQRGIRDAAEREATREALLAGTPNAMRIGRANADEAIEMQVKRSAAAATGRTPADLAVMSRAKKIGSFTGAAAGQFPGLNTENVGVLSEDGTDQGDAALALAGTTAASALGALPFERFLGKFGGEAVAATRAKGERYAKRLAKEMGAQGMAEGSAEVAQTAAQRASHSFISDNIDMLGPDALDAYLSAFAGGAILGGAMGGAGETGRAGAEMTGKAIDWAGERLKAFQTAARERLTTFKQGQQEALQRARERFAPGQRMDGAQGASERAGGPSAPSLAESAASLFRGTLDTLNGGIDKAKGAAADAAGRFRQAASDLGFADEVDADLAAVMQRNTEARAAVEQGADLLARAGQIETPIRVKSKLQNLLLSVIPADNPMWQDRTATRNVGRTLEKAFSGKKLDIDDHLILSAMVSDPKSGLSKDRLNTWVTNGPDILEQLKELHDWDSSTYSEQDGTDEDLAIANDPNQEKLGGDDGDVINNVLTERASAQDARGKQSPGDAVANAEAATRAAQADNRPSIPGLQKNADEEYAGFQDAKTKLRESLLGGDGTSGNKALFVQNKTAPEKWAAVEREIENTPNRIEIEPIDLSHNGDGKVIARRALSLDSLINRYINQIDDFDTDTPKGQSARLKAALMMVFADLKSAGIKVRKSSITAGDFGTTKDGMHLGRLTPRDAAELRAMHADPKLSREARFVHDEQGRVNTPEGPGNLAGKLKAEREAALDKAYGKPEKEELMGESKIDSGNDFEHFKQGPRATPPGTKLGDGSRYTPSLMAAADVKVDDRLGEIATKARAAARKMGLVDAGYADPDPSAKRSKLGTKPGEVRYRVSEIEGVRVVRDEKGNAKRVVEGRERGVLKEGVTSRKPQTVSDAADPRHEAGVQIGMEVMQRDLENGNMSPQRFEAQARKLANRASGLSAKFYNDALAGKFANVSTTDAKTDSAERKGYDRSVVIKETKETRRDAVQQERRRRIEGKQATAERNAAPKPEGKVAGPLAEKTKGKVGDKRVAKRDFSDDLGEAAKGDTTKPSDLQALTDAITDALGVERLTVLDDSSVSGGRYNATMRRIRMSEKLKGAERIEVLSHEIGHHVLMSEIAKAMGVKLEDVPNDALNWEERMALFRKGNPELAEGLIADYQAWVASNPRSQDWKATRATRAPYNRAMSVMASKGKRRADLYSFDEYIADNIARALTTRKEGRGIIGKFFSDIAAALRATWRALTGGEKRQWAPAPSVDAWVKDLFDKNRAAVKQVEGHSTTAAHAAKAVEAAVATEIQGEFNVVGEEPQFMPDSLEAMEDYIRYVMNADTRATVDGFLRSGMALKRLREAWGHDEEVMRHLDDAETGVEKRIAYAYMAWLNGQFATGPKVGESMKAMKGKLGALSQLAGTDDLVNRIFNDIANGTIGRYGKNYDVRAREQNARGGLQRNVYAAGRAWDKAYGVIRNVADSKIKRVRDSAIPAFQKIAARIQRPQGTTGTDPGMIPAIRTESTRLMNKAVGAFDGLTPKQRVVAMDMLQRQMTEAHPKWETKPEAVREAVKKMRAFMDEAFDYAKEAGLDIGKRENFFPVLFDTQNKLARDTLTKLYSQPKFEQAIRDLFPYRDEDGNLVPSDKPLDELVKNLVDGAVDEFSGAAKDPMQPTFRGENFRLSQFVYDLGDDADIKAFASVQTRNLAEVLGRYIEPLVKRAEYTRRFGQNGDGLKKMLKDARDQGATPEQIEEVQNHVKAALGTYGADGSPTLAKIAPKTAAKLNNRKVKEALQQAQAYQNLRLLPLSLLSSLVDPMGIAVRTGGDFKTAWTGFREGIKTVFSKASREDMQRALAELYIGDDIVPAIALGEQFQGHQSGISTKINEAVFKYNGMKAWVASTRFMALRSGNAFLLKHATNLADPKSRRYFDELGLEEGDVQMQWTVAPDGKGTPSVKLLSESERAKASKEERARDDRVRNALRQFVDEAVLRPNSQQVPLWHSDPYMSLFTQYKGFAYAMFDQIGGRIGREVKEGNFAVLGAALAYLPIVLIGELLRELIQYGTGGNPKRKDWDVADYTMLAADRSGIMYTPRGVLITDAVEDAQRGSMPGTSLGGPTVGQIKQFATARDYGNVFESALPASAGWKHWNDGASADATKQGT